MTHPREALSAYLDGELPADERRAVELHLAGCPPCAAALEELAAVDALAREAAPPDAPAGYFDALPSRVRARVRAPRRRVSPLWLVPLAAGLMVAVLAPPVLREDAAREKATGNAPARAPADGALAQAPAPAAAPPALVPEEVEGAGIPQPAATPRAREQKREAAPGLAKEAPPAASAVVEAREEPLRRADARQEPFAAAPPAAPASERDADAQAQVAGAGVDVGGRATARDALADTTSAEKAQGTPPPPAQNRAGAAAGRLSATADESGPPKAKKAVADDGFLEAAAIPLGTVEGARRARDAWRRYVAAHPGNDEALVRLVEAAVAAYRASGDAGDRAIAERDAESYLARGDGPGAERVRAARRALQR